jgi:beta-lactamase regulating signal transducer with metallopeptidase domain
VKELLSTLAMMAVQGTVLTAIALVITRGRRIPPAWQAAVWLVVICKFALPWSPALPWSLADVLAMLRGEPVAAPMPVNAIASGAAPVETSLSIGWLALSAAWAAGALVVILRANRAERSALAIARRSPLAPNGRAILAELGAPRRVRLVVGDAVTGPYVVGLLRPIIVVPPALLADATLLRAALLHELAHVRRFDALGRLVQLIARAAFWWFPVVALASRRLEAAREAACDARALEVGRIERPAYARLLLQMAQLRSTGTALAAPYALDHRIQSVLGPPRRSRLGAIHAIALLAWIGVALGGPRSADARGVETCVYNTQLAEALRLAHPEADVDNDGILSRDEACEFQAELRKVDMSTYDEPTAAFVAEPLCCNCAVNGEGPASPTDATCTAD